MAHDPKALVRFAESFMGANAVVSLYFYGSNHTAAEIATAGFFNADRYRLKPGDVITCSIDVDGTRDTRQFVMNAVPASGDVTVTEGSARASASSSISILSLTDVPDVMGTSGQILKVNGGATALEFAADA